MRVPFVSLHVLYLPHSGGMRWRTGLLLSLVRLSLPLKLAKPALLKHMQAAKFPVVLLDGNNIRGCAVFSASYAELNAAAVCWAEEHGLPTLLVMDHGAEQRAWATGTSTALAMSGGVQNADDVIVRDAAWLAAAGRRQKSDNEEPN